MNREVGSTINRAIDRAAGCGITDGGRNQPDCAVAARIAPRAVRGAAEFGFEGLPTPSKSGVRKCRWQSNAVNSPERAPAGQGGACVGLSALCEPRASLLGGHGMRATPTRKSAARSSLRRRGAGQGMNLSAGDSERSCGVGFRMLELFPVSARAARPVDHGPPAIRRRGWSNRPCRGAGRCAWSCDFAKSLLRRRRSGGSRHGSAH